MCLAQALRLMPGKALRDDPVRQAESLQALDRVLKLRPWLVEAYDQKARSPSWPR
jgi:hypothetical protein